MATTFKSRLEDLEPEYRRKEEHFNKYILPKLVNMKPKKKSQMTPSEMGKRSWEKQTQGKTEKEIREMMSKRAKKISTRRVANKR